MGILIYEKYLFYLIDEDSSPFWFPYILFEISDSNVNSKWHFKILENNENTYGEFIYGYFELCFLEGHNDGLMERKENDLRIYFRNKIIMETT